MKLFTYYRSSAAYRVRIALNIKGLNVEAVPVHLVKDGGQQKAPEYLDKNPQGLVPLLELDDESSITQSLAMIEYLDELHPEPSLIPGDALERAQVRALSLAIACDIHPLNNLRVLQYLTRELGSSDEQKNQWYQHWIQQGFTAVEKTLSQTSLNGEFCITEQPTMADCCLIPQAYNAQRFKVDMSPYPLISSINEHCLSLPAFAQAAPAKQADAE